MPQILRTKSIATISQDITRSDQMTFCEDLIDPRLEHPDTPLEELLEGDQEVDEDQMNHLENDVFGGGNVAETLSSCNEEDLLEEAAILLDSNDADNTVDPQRWISLHASINVVRHKWFAQNWRKYQGGQP